MCEIIRVQTQYKLKNKRKMITFIEKNHKHNRYYTIDDFKCMHNIYYQINISNITMSLYNY